MRATRSRKKGFLCASLAVVLSLGLVLPNVMNAWAENDPHTITLDENCVAFEDGDGTYGITCEVEEVEMEFTLRFGWIAEDGGFHNFEASDFSGFSIGQNDLNKDVITITDDEIMKDGFIHLYEPEYEDENHPEIVGMIDGQEVHLDAGNLKISDVDDKNFGLGVKHEDDRPEGEGPNVWWEYGPYDGQTYGGTITLVGFCEPAWAYDENAEPGTYVNCVDIDGDYEVEGKPVVAHQDSTGGEVFAAHGVKLMFTATPNEDFEFDDLDFFTEPEDIELNVSGAGDEEGAEFEFEVPENTGINIVGYFNFVSENALEVWDEGSDCGTMLPRILTAEAEDLEDPSKLAFVIYCDYEEIDSEADAFLKDLYGDADAFKEYVESLYDAEEEEGKIFGLVMNKYGQIMAVNFRMSLVDKDTEEEVEYDGDGITINFAMSDWLGYFGEALSENYDGEMDVLFAHIKKDGSVEYIPVTQNDDGSFTIVIKNMSPFALIGRAIKDVPDDNPSTDDEVGLYIVIGMAAVVVLGTTFFAIRKTIRK